MLTEKEIMGKSRITKDGIMGIIYMRDEMGIPFNRLSKYYGADWITIVDRYDRYSPSKESEIVYNKEIGRQEFLEYLEYSNMDYMSSVKCEIDDFFYELYDLDILAKNEKKRYMRTCERYMEQLKKEFTDDKTTISKNISKGFHGSGKRIDRIGRMLAFYALRIDMEKKLKPLYHHVERYSRNDYFDIQKLIQKHVIKIDDTWYKRTVRKKALETINLLEEIYEISLDREETTKAVIKSIDFLKNNPLIHARKGNAYKYTELLKIIKTDGMNLDKIMKVGHFFDFMPENIALFLVFFLNYNTILAGAEQKPCLDALCCKVGIPFSELNKLKMLFIEDLQLFWKNRIKNHPYTDKLFTLKVTEIYKKTNSVDALTVLILHEILKLKIREFRKVLSYKATSPLSHVIWVLENSSIGQSQYLKIRKTISRLLKKKIIDKQQHALAVEVINKAIDVKVKVMEHGCLRYSLKYSSKSIKKISNRNLRTKILTFIRNVEQDNYSIERFEQIGEDDVRCSSFKIQGNKKERMLTKTIIEELVNPLIESGDILYNSTEKTITRLQEIAKEMFELYRTNFGVKPAHDPILTKTLMDTDVIAIETPIWNDSMTGHIDLLKAEGKILIVGEYKPNKNQMYKNLPQAIVYAYLLSETLHISIKNVQCVIYTPKESLSFKPTIITHVIDFLHDQNSKRTEELNLMHTSISMEKELVKLVN